MKKLFQVLTVVFIGLGAAQFALAEALYIDVRTAEEYAQDHIDGDAHIPHDQIAAEIGKITTDTNAEIHVYCRSGRRAGIAKDTLNALGYKQVTNEGTIDEARTKRNIKS